MTNKINEAKFLADMRSKAESVLAAEGIVRTEDNELEYEQEILGVYRRLTAIMPARRMIYLWDNHGHTKPYPCYFYTNCRLPLEDVQKIAWRRSDGMGRIATSFDDFKEDMAKAGYDIELLEMGRPENDIDPSYEVVRGITGNY